MAGSTVQLWDYWFILRKRKFMILATIAVVMFIVVLVNLLQKPIYSASCDLILEVNQPTRILSSSSNQTTSSALDSVFFDTQAKLMQSSFFAGLVADELVKNRAELPDYLKNTEKSQLTGLSKALISIPSLGSARIMRITVENYDPKLAALLANTIAKIYIKYTQESQASSSQNTLVVLMQKLEELSSASQVYGENHPIMIALKAKKKELEDSLIAKGEIAKPETEETLNSHGSSTEAIKDKIILSYNPKASEELYQILLKKLQELDVTRDVSAYNIRIIEQAIASSKPARPNKRLNVIIGLLMGFVMGTGLAFFREYLDTTIKTVEELKNSFNLPVLGMIPSIDSGNAKPKSTAQLFWDRLTGKNKKIVDTVKNEVTDELKFQVHRLASAEQLKAPIAEAYRTLRTNLQFIQVDKPLKTLLITSSIRGEGKTTTSVNLGIILAQTGKKILIVDTDLRRPRIHKAFHTGREVGLTNLLLGESCLEDVVIQTDVPNLTILPCGPLPPNPAELISSERMKKLIKYMESKYDMVLFDSPPLVAVTDAALLSADVDGIILVVEAGALPRELFKQGLERLTNVKANILGGVLNNVNLQKGSQYYYYYHYYHYDYASADKA